MKLFLKEHALLIVIQIVQFSAVMGIYWLDGYRNAGPALYSIMLGLFLLSGYLVYHYYSR
jgi:OmpR family two-component system sensor histidine kinase YxdK